MLRQALAVLVVVGALLPAAAGPADAARSRVSVRVETSTPQVGGELAVSGTVRPQERRRVVLQRQVGARWLVLDRGTSDRRGRYRLTAPSTTAGTWVLRVAVAGTRRHRSVTSKVVRVSVAPVPVPPPVVPPVPPTPEPCRPGPGPVDPDADAATVSLLATLDEWRCAGRMAVGQQVNISSDTWDTVLDVAPARFRVVGFDLTELQDALDIGKTDRIARLVELAQDGHVLNASWHARNPWTGGPADDEGGAVDLTELLVRGEPGTPSGRFWSAWDQHLESLRLLGDAGVPVVVRPLHEPGGSWFWWGQPDPADYHALFAALQAEAEAQGVHNLLWAYSAAAVSWEGVADPVPLVPDRVDLGGTDTYDCEVVRDDCGVPAGEVVADDNVDLGGYAAVASAVRRMALTEVGPSYSDGSWDPRVVTDTLRSTGTNAIWAMFWFDDGPGQQWKKAVRSLQGGAAWLASCPDGFCSVPGAHG